MQPTMVLRIKRYKNYSYAETSGVQYEDTLQQLWVDPSAEDYEDAGSARLWRDVEIVEVK